MTRPDLTAVQRVARASDPRLFTYSETARRLGVSKRTVERYAAEGVLPVTRLPRRAGSKGPGEPRISADTLADFIDGHTE